MRTLPLAMVAYVTETAVLYDFLDALCDHTGRRPPRGRRAGHPTTALIVAANNRLAQLGAATYASCRQARRERSTVNEPGDEVPPHLSLFS